MWDWNHFFSRTEYFPCSLHNREPTLRPSQLSLHGSPNTCRNLDCRTTDFGAMIENPAPNPYTAPLEKGKTEKRIRLFLGVLLAGRPALDEEKTPSPSGAGADPMEKKKSKIGGHTVEVDHELCHSIGLATTRPSSRRTRSRTGFCTQNCTRRTSTPIVQIYRTKRRSVHNSTPKQHNYKERTYIPRVNIHSATSILLLLFHTHILNSLSTRRIA